MLLELSIRNFAIIEDLSIRLGKGLTILSGETGAGKSIIINAVNMLLGNRASSALIRTGADSAELEALFDIPAESSTARAMKAQDLDPSEGLLVRRIISNNERHRIYINGRLSTIQLLGELTASLASISGQHAHQGLLREEDHLQILDQFGDLLKQRQHYDEIYSEMVQLIHKERELIKMQTRQSEQIELLRFQRQEIESCKPLPGEDGELEKERLRLKNGHNLYQTVNQCIEGLYGADGAVVEQLGVLSKELNRAGRLDEFLASRASDLDEIAIRIEDLTGHLRDYLKKIDLDPQRLEAVEQRLDRLNRLKRKYGGSLEAVVAKLGELDRSLQSLDSLDKTIAEVHSELADRHNRACRLAEQLSTRRSEAAKRLSAKIEKEFCALQMEGARFKVEVQPLPSGRESNPHLICSRSALSENGMDRVSFMIAPNVGEPLKALAAIASGGELSRVVLALRAILAGNNALETIVFDEVDAGIGGSAADRVGKKLAALARRHQILCITHLPQIAKYGEHHFRIVKSVVKGRTCTTITPLSPAERVAEIARMLGGSSITEATVQHAQEMLAHRSSEPAEPSP